MQENVVLIRPPLIRPSHHLTALETFPPLHLAYINGAMKKAGFQSTIIDAQASHQVTPLPNDYRVIVGLIASEIIAQIPSQVDLIGVNCMYTYTWFYDREIIRQLRRKFPEVPIVIGGEHASAVSESLMLGVPEIDAVIVGEGENSFPLLAKRLLEKKSAADIPGVLDRDESGQPRAALPKARIEEPDEIAPPSWDGVDLEFYFSKGSGITQKGKRTLPMIATRGCPHACTFCTVSSMWNSRWTTRTPKTVVNEMKEYMRQYEVTHFDFLDLTLTTSRKWTEQFCAELESAALPVTWALPIGTRSEALDSRLIQRMAKTGLTHIMFSAESASDRTLKAIKKRLNVDHLSECLSASVKSGIIVKLVFVNGFPGQNWSDIFSNFLYLIKAAWLGVHDVVSLGFVPYPGSELYNQLISEGKLDTGFESIRLNNDLRGMRSWTSAISNEALGRISVASMLGFYALQFALRPHRFFMILWRLLGGKPPYTNFELIVFNLVKSRVAPLVAPFKAGLRWSSREL